LITPRSFGAYVGRAMAKNAMEQYADAVRDLDSALSIQRSAEVYLYRGKTKISLKQYADAVMDIALYLVYIPNNADAYFASAYAKSRVDNLGDPLPDFNKAIELDKNNPDYYYYRAVAYYAQALHTNSKEDFQH